MLDPPFLEIRESLWEHRDKDSVYGAHRASPLSCLPAAGFYPWHSNCSTREHVFLFLTMPLLVPGTCQPTFTLANVIKTQPRSYFLKEAFFSAQLELKSLPRVAMTFTSTPSVPTAPSSIAIKLCHTGLCLCCFGYRTEDSTGPGIWCLCPNIFVQPVTNDHKR